MKGSNIQKVVHLFVQRDESTAVLNFTSAGGETFCFILTKAHSIYHTRANVLLLDSNGSRTSYSSVSPQSSTYMSIEGTNYDSMRNSAIVTFYKNGEMNALVLRNGEAYNLFPSRKLTAETDGKIKAKDTDQANIHVLSRRSETWEHEHAACGTKSTGGNRPNGRKN
mmetsp:Transcript_25626/g.31502  ORF Transcript_25626/g.31502 Transcript_25626/m.31502 type:complete len:167 (+) Transcript_25626:376-876(+)